VDNRTEEGRSLVVIIPHEGEAEAKPVPVCVKKFLAVLVLPERHAAVFVPEPYMRSPRLEIGERALNAAADVDCPVPPPETGITGRSENAIVPQDGTFAAEPVPVEVKKPLVVEVLPGSLTSIPFAD
jgi:hypothetical protein